MPLGHIGGQTLPDICTQILEVQPKVIKHPLNRGWNRFQFEMMFRPNV